jgi:hypothetical protein
MAYAFGTQARIYHINLFSLGNSAIRAFLLADVAVDAFVGNDQRHINPDCREIRGFPFSIVAALR